MQIGGEGRLQEAFLGAIIIVAVLIHTHVKLKRRKAKMRDSMRKSTETAREDAPLAKERTMRIATKVSMFLVLALMLVGA